MEYFLGILGLILIGILLYAPIVAATPIQFTPPSFDEEVEWLLTYGLTQEEAEEIANLPLYR